MSQLGERLRTARERQGITLAQVAAETRILQRYLLALEDGDYHQLPGDVYTRGFVRNYARYLGLPADELIELYRQERGFSEPIKIVPVTSTPRIRGLFIPSFFGVFFVVLALVGLSYLALSATNRIGESALATTPAPTVAPTPLPLPTAAPNATAIAIISAPPTAAPAVSSSTTPSPVVPTPALAGGIAGTTPSPEAPIVGEVRITAPDGPGSWMNILVDGKSTYQGTLRSGKRVFLAQRRIEVRIGNAGAVAITVNGQDFVDLGGDGEPVTFRWPR